MIIDIGIKPYYSTKLGDLYHAEQLNIDILPLHSIMSFMKSYKTISIKGKQKRLHRYIMECFLGRQLTSQELVHHKDGDKLNNTVNNLELIDRATHIRLHFQEVGNKGSFKKSVFIDDNEFIKVFQTMSTSKLAKYFNCSTTHISLTRRRLGLRKNGYPKKITKR